MFEIQSELAYFLQAKNPNWSELFQDVYWRIKLAYMADIFVILNEYLNAGRNGYSLYNDKQYRLAEEKSWSMENSCLKKNVDMFHNLSATIA